MENRNKDNMINCDYFLKENIGKIFKKSKCLYTWAFYFQGKLHTIKLFHSKICNKISIYYDKYNIKDKEKFKTGSSVSVHCEGIDVLITRYSSENFELRLNSFEFGYLKMLNQNKQSFNENH